MTSRLAAAAIALSALLASAEPLLAASKTERVRFKPGAISATVRGSVTGYDTHSYLLGASAGQVMSVLFSGNLNACYMNVIEPGAGSDTHRGEMDGNEYSANLRKSGDYRAEIYLMRSEARRGKTCRFTITFEISG